MVSISIRTSRPTCHLRFGSFARQRQVNSTTLGSTFGATGRVPAWARMRSVPSSFLPRTSGIPSEFRKARSQRRKCRSDDPWLGLWPVRARCSCCKDDVGIGGECANGRRIHRVHLARRASNHLGKSEVRELDLLFRRDLQVCQFQITHERDRYRAQLPQEQQWSFAQRSNP